MFFIVNKSQISSWFPIEVVYFNESNEGNILDESQHISVIKDSQNMIMYEIFQKSRNNPTCPNVTVWTRIGR